MKKPYTPTSYRKAFQQRVFTARTWSSKTQREVAELLGIETGTYSRYETRLMMPQHLLGAFCEITGADMHWLVTGIRPAADPGGAAGASNGATPEGRQAP